MDIGYLAAFLGGLLALLSPCSALLLPGLLRVLDRLGLAGCWPVPGSSTRGWRPPWSARAPPARSPGGFFYGHRDQLVSAGGWLIIALGLAQILGLGFASAAISELSGRIRPTTALSVVRAGRGLRAGRVLRGPDPGQRADGRRGAAAAPSTAACCWRCTRWAWPYRCSCWPCCGSGSSWAGGAGCAGGPCGSGRFELHTTSLLSGLFFITLGALFLAFDGASALPGLLDVDDSFAVEQWVGSWRTRSRTGRCSGWSPPGRRPSASVQWRRREPGGRPARPRGSNHRRPRPMDGAFLMVAGAGVEPATYRFSGDRSYQLSYPATKPFPASAILTGLEPATSTLTGWRANQLLHRTLQCARTSLAHGNAYPQRDSNPCYRLERAASWATRR